MRQFVSVLALAIIIPTFDYSDLSAQASNGSPASAEHADATIGIHVGTLGLGVEVGKLLTDHLGARIGANYWSLNTTKRQTDIDYVIKAKLQAITGLLDFYPSSRGSFHLSGGIMTNPLKVTATGQPTASGTFKINGNTYTAAQVGTLTGEAKYPSAKPYLGLGFGTPAHGGSAVKFFFDLGAMLGTPGVSLSATGAATNAQLQSDLNAQIATTQKNVEKLKVYPVLSLGLALSF